MKAPKRGQGRWVLVVDDDEDIREALCEMLVDEGYAATTAAHGEEAMRLLRGAARPPDLVLLDLRMPRGSGWDVLAAMSANPVLAATPVIVVTADRVAVPRGAVDCLPKPVMPEILLASVARHLRA